MAPGTKENIDMALQKIISRMRGHDVEHGLIVLTVSTQIARRMADLIQIGSLPGKPDIVAQLREQSKHHDLIRLQIDATAAHFIASRIENGFVRVEAGAGDPEEFRIH